MASDLVWAELVMHVLAHLSNTAHLPSTLHDPSYVAHAKGHLGSPSERALGADINVLSAVLTRHEQLVEMQLVARLHPSLAAARRAATRALSELTGNDDTDRAIAAQLLAGEGVAAELLRCSALLEAPHFLAWPLPELTLQQGWLDQALPEFWVVAPRLRRFGVRMVRGLGLRGRAWPDEIWVGIPNEHGMPSLNHVLWQAAHEATVVEVAEAGQTRGWPLSERGIERIAVPLLARRAARAGAPEGHASWLSRLDPECAEWASEQALSRAERAILERFE